MWWAPLPALAAWRHIDVRNGFETAFFRTSPAGFDLHGHTAAVEDDDVWAVKYEIALDPAWTTRSARVWGSSQIGEFARSLQRDGLDRWVVDGVHIPALDGCEDIDLESSACTNTIPVHRLALEAGKPTPAPAAYVRASDLAVERLQQQYTRVADHEGLARFAYEAPAFDYSAILTYDGSGLVVDYPGIATRAR